MAAVLDRLPESFRRRVAQVLVSDDASDDSTHEVGLAYQAAQRAAADGHPSRPQPRLRRQPEERLSVGDRPRPRHRRPAPRRRAVRPGGDRGPRRPADRRARRRRVRFADAHPRRRPRRGDAAVQVRRQPHPDARRERARRARPVGVAQRLPRLPGRRARRHPVRVVLRRVRLRHRDHPRPARRREVDRRGADPDLLRRRDLLRQRRCATPRTSPPTSSATGCSAWASAGRSATDDDAYELKLSPHSSHAVLLQWLAERQPGRLLDVGCSDGQFGAIAATRRSARHRRRRRQARRRRRAPRRVRRGRPQQGAAAGDRRPASTASSPPTSSSTRSRPSICSPTSPIGSPLAARSSSASPTSPIGTRGSGWPPGASTTTSAALLDRGHVRFFTRRSFERLVDDCQLGSRHGGPSSAHRSKTSSIAAGSRRRAARFDWPGPSTGPRRRSGRRCSATSSCTSCAGADDGGRGRAVPPRVRNRRPRRGHDDRPAQRRPVAIGAHRHRAPRRGARAVTHTGGSTPSPPRCPAARRSCARRAGWARRR